MSKKLISMFLLVTQIWSLAISNQPQQTIAFPTLFENFQSNSQIIRIISASYDSSLSSKLLQPLFDPYKQKEFYRPIWLEIKAIIAVFLDELQEKGLLEIANDPLFALTQKKLKQHGIEITQEHFHNVLQKLIKLGAIKTNNNIYKLNLTPLNAGIWVDDVEFLQNVFMQILNIGDQKTKNDVLHFVLNQCCEIVDSQPLYPIETRYPLLRTIALMDSKNQQILQQFISMHKSKHPLLNSISLMLEKNEENTYSWLSEHAKNLSDVRIYEVTAEGQNVKGGLGRVEQYHTLGMKQLGADVVFVEPFYRYKRTSSGERVTADYLDLTGSQHSIAVPLLYINLEMSFSLNFRGEILQVDVYKGKNIKGVDVFLIRDHEDKYVKTLYEYGSYDNPKMEEFTEFFTRASWEFIKLEERRRRIIKQDLPDSIINLNDGQTLPLALWRNLDKISFPRDPFIKRIFVSATTHTYKNRCFFGQDDDILERMSIPRQYSSSSLNDINGYDFTSMGIRNADFTKAVAGIHAYEVNPYDPDSTLYGITNGDDILSSTARFREVMEEIGIKKQYLNYDLTQDEIIKIKRRAKEKLGLNPDQMLISYSGRFVLEKAGQDRAFTPENIEELVKQGVQVVIYGNVQPYESSMAIGEKFKRLEKEIRKKGYSGRFIFKPLFTLQEQIELLSATDVQVQDSDRNTGACEYTESDVSANGGLQFSPPYQEGIIAKQGLAINFQNLTGNTAVPSDSSPQAYLATFKKLVELYQKSQADFAKLQLNSIKLSRVLHHKLTASEYLRQWSRHIDDRTTIKTDSGLFWSVTEKEDSFEITINSLQKTEQEITLHWGQTINSNPNWHETKYEKMQIIGKNGQGLIYSTTIIIPKKSDYTAIEFVIKYPNIHKTDSNNGKNYRINLVESLKTTEQVFYTLKKNGDDLLIELIVKNTKKPTIHFGKVFGSEWEDIKEEEMEKHGDKREHLWRKIIRIPILEANCDIGFVLKYESNGKIIWDNNSGKNYIIGLPEISREILNIFMKKVSEKFPYLKPNKLKPIRFAS